MPHAGRVYASVTVTDEVETIVRLRGLSAIGADGVVPPMLMTLADAKQCEIDALFRGNVFVRPTERQVPNEDGELETVYERIDPDLLEKVEVG